MGQAQQTRGAVLIVEDDAELRRLTVTLLKTSIGHHRVRKGGSCASRHPGRPRRHREDPHVLRPHRRLKLSTIKGALHVSDAQGSRVSQSRRGVHPASRRVQY
jgi:hypothetical protein